MSDIEWTDVTWNPAVGCSRVSAGCMNCYAERVAHRGMAAQHKGLTRLSSKGPQWTGEVRFLPEKIAEPLSWRKPRRVFVNSMSDLFHDGLTNEQIAAVFGVMAACPRHTFQVLTKRPERMVRWFEWATDVATDSGSGRFNYQAEACRSHALDMAPNNKAPNGAWSKHLHPLLGYDQRWPLPNVWLGVSAENQATADERIPLLLQTPAAVRFVSAEPLLGPVDLTPWLTAHPSAAQLAGKVTDDMPGWTRIGAQSLDWVIVGGESGPGARPCDVAWVRSIVDQCREAQVACFVKQLGAAPFDSREAGRDSDEPYPGGPSADPDCRLSLVDRKGGDPAEWPAELRVRQFPEVRRG